MPRPAPEPGALLPRLTSRVFKDLAIYMLGFGLLIGLVFPYAILPAGVPRAVAIRPAFFALTIVAGLTVGGVAYALARAVVGRRLEGMRDRMQHVASAIENATHDGNWARCSPDACALSIDSDDVVGEVAASFNRLIDAVATSRRHTEEEQVYAHSMAVHLDLDDLARAALQGLIDRTGADAGAVLVQADGELTIAAGHRLQGDPLTGSCLIAHALRHHEAAHVEVPEGLAVDAALVAFRPAAVSVVPVDFAGTPVGALLLAFARPPAPEVLLALEQLRDVTGVALHNALTHERFQRLAAIDPLTGAYNRRFGTGRLSEEFARATRAGTPLGVLTFDLDHFKRVNDTYGHLAGDQVLREVVQAASSVLRAGDVLVRTGGEEFLVVAPGAAVRDLHGLAERLRAVIAGNTVHIEAATLQVTVSVGAASYPATPASAPEELLEGVDRALYRSKREGRDRTTVIAGDAVPQAV